VDLPGIKFLFKVRALVKVNLVACLFVSQGLAAGEFDYFAMTPPGAKPKIFSFQGLVPEGMMVGNPTFSPDGNEFYFTEEHSRNIFVMKRSGGKWLAPEQASFSDLGHNYEPFISQSNRELFFVSTRPPGSGKYNGRIWQVKRKEDGSWGQPVLLLDRPTKEGFWFPTSPGPGLLYFGATLADSLGEGDFYQARLENGHWQISHLKPPFNTPGYEWDPLVSPDGSYMVFQSERPGGFGGTDIYVSFKTGESWGAPVNLGSSINTAEYETAAKITPDGRFMFYTLVPDKGKPVIYWVSTEVITALKPQ